MDDGKYVPKKTLLSVNEEKRVLDFYHTLKCDVLRWEVLERSKPFEDYLANGTKDDRKECELYCEVVTRHPSWSLGIPRLIKRTEKQEISREFERLVQGNKETITSFFDCFTEATCAYRIFFERTEKQEMNNFVTKVRVDNQKQLEILRIETDYIDKELSRGMDLSTSARPSRTGMTRTRRDSKEEGISSGGQRRAEGRQGRFSNSNEQG